MLRACPHRREPAGAGTRRAPVRRPRGLHPQESGQPHSPSPWPPHPPPPRARAPREEARCRVCSEATALWPLINPASSPRDGVGTFSHPPAPSDPPGAGQPVVPNPAELRLLGSQPPSAPPGGQALLAPGLEEQVAQRNQVFTLICPSGERGTSPASPRPPQSPPRAGGTATARLRGSPHLQNGEICASTADLLPFPGLSPGQAAPSP